jgi:hypothetical protein
LDERTSFLVKLAENSIVNLEDSLPKDGQVFSRELHLSDQARRDKRYWNRMWTYREALHLVFNVVKGIGLIGAALCGVGVLALSDKDRLVLSWSSNRFRASSRCASVVFA